MQHISEGVFRQKVEVRWWLQSGSRAGLGEAWCQWARRQFNSPGLLGCLRGLEAVELVMGNEIYVNDCLAIFVTSRNQLSKLV